MTIQIAYRQTLQQLSHLYGEREAHNIVRILFEDAFNIRNFNREDELLPEQYQQLQNYTERLKLLEPVQYVLSQADFYGMKLKISPAVLIPRPETEELVWWISTLELAPKTILDIGTGSGCIALGLKKAHPIAEVQAIDISEQAINIARQNSDSLRLPVTFHVLNILKEENWKLLPVYDLIVSNPPYIPPSEKQVMPGQVLEYEPELALLVPQHDPLLFYRQIAHFALQHLSDEGSLFFEINEFFASETKRLFEDMGFNQAVLQKDMQGKNRMLWVKK